jgi:hypothetical protein
LERSNKKKEDIRNRLDLYVWRAADLGNALDINLAIFRPQISSSLAFG